MKKKLIIATISVFACCTLLCVLVILSDPNNVFIDITEHPLKLVDAYDHSEYVLVKNENGKYEVVTDTKRIKENASVFSIDNSGGINGSTPSGIILLYKDGEQIDSAVYDDNFTKKSNMEPLSSGR